MNEDFRTLMNKYQAKTITAEEMKRLAILLESPEHQLTLAAILDESFAMQNWIDEGQVDSEKIYEKIKEATASPKAKVVFMRRKRYSWIAAAAVVIVALSVWFVTNKQERGREVLNPAYTAKNIKAPMVNRATITLADGSTVFLDSVSNGQLALQGNTKLIKLADGQIAYQTSGGEVIKKLEYNTLSNPRGSKVIDMKLSDGSHVWLNSGSSITFPVAFTGKDRKITVDGEAYFEVAHDPSRPFIVSKGTASVEVLGTHFNINAYSDEKEMKVTLLQGSVKVSLNTNSKIIKPGQQAAINEEMRIKEVDVDEVMSWKDGIFLLNNTDLPAIMRQIGRWYDVNIVYEGKISAVKFGGGVSKDEPLSKILETLEQYGLRFELEGKTLKVL